MKIQILKNLIIKIMCLFIIFYKKYLSDKFLSYIKFYSI
ncbi:hypothetical protein J502_1543 [Acinetobacter sp. 1294596]|nr:hypothetical protein J502_1543 [Acinetobacter sp. 1294596]